MNGSKWPTHPGTHRVTLSGETFDSLMNELSDFLKLIWPIQGVDIERFTLVKIRGEFAIKIKYNI